MIPASYILWTLSLALKLSIVRWALMLFYWPSEATWRDALKTVLMGFRFDLMIIGFWLAPVVLYLIVAKVVLKGRFLHTGLMKLYLLFSWFFICFLYFKSLVSFPELRDHLYWPDHLRNPFLDFQHATQLAWWAWVTIILLCLGLFQSGAQKFQEFIQKFQRLTLFSLAFIFLWTAFMARGTLTQHHLRKRDCEFSGRDRVTNLCLNPIWTFSKNR